MNRLIVLANPESADEGVGVLNRAFPALVCSPKSGPLIELVPASDMELNYGQET